MNTDFSFVLQRGEELGAKRWAFPWAQPGNPDRCATPWLSSNPTAMCTCVTRSSVLMLFIQKDCRAIQSKQERASSPQMLDHAVSLQGRPFKKGSFTDWHHQQLGRSKCARNFSWYRCEGKNPKPSKIFIWTVTNRCR